MKLQLSQEEIIEAINRYVGGLLTLSEGADMTIEFTAGRGDKGLVAEVDIRYLSVKSINLGAASNVVGINKAPAPGHDVSTSPVVKGPTLPMDQDAIEAAKAAAAKAAAEGKPLDGRSKEAKILKSAGLFGPKPEVPTEPMVMDKVDRAVKSFKDAVDGPGKTEEPSEEEEATADRAAESEASKILGGRAEEAEEILEEEEEAKAPAVETPPPTETPVRRKSLFSS